MIYKKKPVDLFVYRLFSRVAMLTKGLIML
ncbi:hypothetical protein SAMN05444146_2672 [Flavobacterium johnsoniae]|nr:hypothetical protein SAMN05444146_2672 [Flavobacterium johnsoniae]